MSDVRIAVTVEGVTPLMINRFQVQANGKSTPAHRTNNDDPRDVAERCLYVGGNGELSPPYVPGWNLYKSIMQAGIYFKIGKRQLTTGPSSMLPGMVFIEEAILPITPKNWEVDSRPVRMPSTGGRVIRHRPMFNQWKLKFHLSVDTELMDLKLLRDVVDAAGKRVGLGEFRPACKGMYGKFVVTNWRQLKSK